MTALFADISGFTTLADQLDVEDLHAVINPLIAGLAGIAERYGGFVAKYAGDALLCLFGAPISHEDDAQRALLAALEMQSTLPTLLEPLGPQAGHLTIHIGVNTGKVVAGAVGSVAQADYSVLGDSVILAQRLESVCPPGQTYVGTSTRDRCAEEFDFEDLGDLQLKGKLHAVRALRLIGRRRVGTDTTRPLIGRGSELSAVLSTIERRGVVVVFGEPGVGKSRLLAEARLRATATDAMWLPMRCLSYGAGLPYWPFTDLLRQALGVRIEDPVEQVWERIDARLPGHLAAGAARLLGLQADVLDPQAARREIHEALAGMLKVVSGGRPVVMAVEDVHWIDSSSAEALGQLNRVPDGVALAIVCTSREEGRNTVELLFSGATITTVDLAPLSAEVTPLLAAAVLGAPVGPALAAALQERGGGNALFVQELALSLRESTRLVETSAGLDLPPGFDASSLPDTVGRVLAARIDLLEEPDAHVLSTCAAIGQVVRLSLLSAVLGSDPAEQLSRLTSAELLDTVLDSDEPAVSFHHNLLQEVVYSQLLRKHKKELHRLIADTGRALYGDTDNTVELLARHLYLAEAGLEAVDPLLRAGRRARQIYANDAAAEHLSRAVEVLEQHHPTSRLTLEARLSLAAVEEVRGCYDAALALYDLIRVGVGDPVAWRGSLAVRRMLGDYSSVVELFLSARDTLDTTAPPALPLWIETANSLALQGRFADAVMMLATLLRLPACTDGAVRGEALSRLAWAESQLKLPAAQRHAQDAVRLLEHADNPHLLVSALRVAGGIHADLGERQKATALLDRGVAVAERIGLTAEAAGCLVNAGFLDLEEDPAAAVPRFRSALDLFTLIGHQGGRCVALANIADALTRLNRMDEAGPAALEALGLAQRIGYQLAQADVLHTMARAALAVDDLSEAATLAEQAAALFGELDLKEQQQAAQRTAEQALSATFAL